MATRKSKPAALAAVTRHTADVRHASHRWRARFDASTNALLPLSASAPSPQSCSKNSVSCTVWYQANRRSVIPQRSRHERHVIALRPRVFETLRLCSLAQTLSLVGTPLLPVDRIPNEGVRQRNVCEKRCQTPPTLVIWSVENVADPTRGVKLSREAVRRINPRCENSLLQVL